MRIAFVILVLFLTQSTSAFAACSKTEVCEMLGKMGHFDILNQCPDAGSLLAECRKVTEVTAETLGPPEFIDNGDGTISDTKNHLLWAKAGVLKDGKLIKASLKEAKRIALSSEIAGKGGWRLPTLSELQTLTTEERIENVSGKKAWINPVFDDGRGHYYWTTTTCAEVSFIEDRYQKKICQQGEEAVWLIHFNINAVFWHHSTAENYHIWLVQNIE
ncbi:MAG: hypothetical protein COV66_04155 [Nitrospinae bacterium CG11_big_fil_rev_8_21_14_0_20_45_15]|nr:MAG: hypothetical protein COV66_04155 [Nitrospinae bacterium CG11_big_fil_rev_8_21_14_0_20_45_15]